MVIAGLVLLVVVGLVVLMADPKEDLRVGSERIARGPADGVVRVPRSYRISYRIETNGPDEVIRTTESVAVHRPFEARVEESVHSFARFAVRGSAFWVPPTMPAPDRRPDAMLDEAVRDGYAQLREYRRVVGRTCRVVRIGAGSGEPSLPLLDRTRDRSDVCIDEAGLLLEEVTYDGSDIARRRLAIRVSEDPNFPADAFDVPKPSGDPQQIGSVQELEPDSRLPGDVYWELPKAPKGFRLEGRFAVVPPGQPGFTDPTAHASIITFSSEVWTDGPNVLVIDQGATLGAKPFEKDPNARDVKGGELGMGQQLYSMTASEVRFLTAGPRFVRVRGTLAPSRLLAIARSLEAKPGGPLRLL